MTKWSSGWGSLPAGPGPRGLFHWVSGTDGGARIVDVWRIREQTDAFYQDKLGTVTAELGIAQPQISYFDVHNFSDSGTRGPTPAGQSDGRGKVVMCLQALRSSPENAAPGAPASSP
jgi:hypothetical protein